MRKTLEIYKLIIILFLFFIRNQNIILLVKNNFVKVKYLYAKLEFYFQKKYRYVKINIPIL